MRLSQVIAVEKSVKNQCNNDITAAYHDVQKTDLFKGIARTYQSKDEDGEKFPDEHQKVQRRAADLLKFTAEKMTHYWDMTVTKDTANCEAFGDVELDGKKILTRVPVTTLLFLEKQLVDLATIVKKLPTLDAGEDWSHDATTNAYVTKPAQSVKTKKIPRAFEKSPATKEHPAQVETFTEDVVIGTWTTRKYSGALPQKEVTDVLDRIQKLQAAVKQAREEANTRTCDEKQIGKQVFHYVLGA